MTHRRAIDILELLMEGIHPVTGEILTENVLSEPDVIQSRFLLVELFCLRRLSCLNAPAAAARLTRPRCSLALAAGQDYDPLDHFPGAAGPTPCARKSLRQSSWALQAKHSSTYSLLKWLRKQPIPHSGIAIKDNGQDHACMNPGRLAYIAYFRSALCSPEPIWRKQQGSTIQPASPARFLCSFLFQKKARIPPCQYLFLVWHPNQTSV